MWEAIYDNAYEFWESFYNPPTADKIAVLEAILDIADAGHPFQLRGSYVSEVGPSRRFHFPSDDTVILFDLIEVEKVVRVVEIRSLG